MGYGGLFLGGWDENVQASHDDIFFRELSLDANTEAKLEEAEAFEWFRGQTLKADPELRHQIRPNHMNTGRSKGFLQVLVEATSAVATAVVSVAAVAIGTVVIAAGAAAYATANIIRSAVREYQAGSRPANPAGTRDVCERDIRNINSEIFEYESKRYRDGHLNEHETHDLNNLYGRRQEKSVILADANGMVIANKMAHGAGSYDNMHVTNANTHVLQFHVGQTVFGKHCSRCGAAMSLQWRQNLLNVRMQDFFWGCTGYFDGQCKNTEEFQQSDMNLFTNTDREEFSIGTQQFNSVVMLPESQSLITKRMGEIVNQPNNTYYCPVHHEAMILRKKRNPEGILDMFFYGCPRWSPSGPSCGQIVKLKSAAQISAAKESMTGRGVL